MVLKIAKNLFFIYFTNKHLYILRNLETTLSQMISNLMIFMQSDCKIKLHMEIRK